MQLAVALFNNDVDNEEELEFRKGDILTVLIENPNGFEGWWLCKHKDKCGLCPENRLKLIHNTVQSPIKLTDFTQSSSRFSTISMYDGLSNNSSSNHDYDNSQRSHFISNIKPFDSSPESSSRSSGIYSTNDINLSSSSSLEYSTNTNHILSLSSIDLKQLQTTFQKLSIHSSLLDKYRQLISKATIESIVHSFITECYSFLDKYGSLLDRYTYKLIKETFLYEIEHDKTRIIQTSTKIIHLIKLIFDLRLKEKSDQHSSIPKDVYRKLHLEPIKEIPDEKVPISFSTTQIYSLPMTNSQICSSKPLTTSFSCNKLNTYSINPLVKCYYRHIHKQTDFITGRYSHLWGNKNLILLLTTDGKALVVAGHKLLFMLETLHEHLQQIQTPLLLLTAQLRQSLTNSIQLLKQFTQQNRTNIQKSFDQFKQELRMIMNLVQRIKHNCSLA